MTGPYEVRCGRCGAKPGQKCSNRGISLKTVHPVRLQAAADKDGRVNMAAEALVQAELFPEFRKCTRPT